VGSAARAFGIAHTFGAQEKSDKFQSIQFNGKTGKYEVLFDQKRFEAANRTDAGPKGINPFPRDVSVYRRADPELADKVHILNQALDHLVETREFDPEVPKNITPLQLRAHYDNPDKVPLEASSGDKKGVPKNPRDQFHAAMDTLLKSAQNITDTHCL
jgi:hypothetical protein